MALEEVGSGHQDPRGAEAALQRVPLPEGPLKRVQLPVRRQALDGSDLRAVGLDGEEQARAHRHAVEDHGAGATDAVLAAHVRAREVQRVAEEVRQQEAGLRHGLAVAAPVHGQLDLRRLGCAEARAAVHQGSPSPSAFAHARSSARSTRWPVRWRW